jgi:hypothetical protein
VTKVIEAAQKVIHPAPTRIVWHYGQHTANLGTLAVHGVELKTGLDGLNDSQDDNDDERTLMIIDDLMMEAGQAQEVSDLFIKGSHHRNVSVILMLQNMFHQGPGMRRISLNSQYIVLMKNPRDVAQIRYLGQQLFPGHTRFFVDAYKQATAQPYGYLLVDLTQTTPDEERIVSDVLEEHGGFRYIPK